MHFFPLAEFLRNCREISLILLWDCEKSRKYWGTSAFDHSYPKCSSSTPQEFVHISLLSKLCDRLHQKRKGPMKNQADTISRDFQRIDCSVDLEEKEKEDSVIFKTDMEQEALEASSCKPNQQWSELQVYYRNFLKNIEKLKRNIFIESNNDMQHNIVISIE